MRLAKSRQSWRAPTTECDNKPLLRLRYLSIVRVNFRDCVSDLRREKRP